MSGRVLNLKPFWRRKRLWLPVALLGSLAIALAWVVHQSAAPRIVVYNQTGTPLPALQLTAGGQVKVFPPMAEETSFAWRLPPTGPDGPIELELATDPPWRWRGGQLEPDGGHRVSLRLWPDGEVEVDLQISIWQRLRP